MSDKLEKSATNAVRQADNNATDHHKSAVAPRQSLNVPEVQNFGSNKDASVPEISIIDNVASFLEAHGAAGVDEIVRRNMAETLTKRLNDTSPGTLQDVTMDNSYGIGYRSPCVSLQQFQGSTSPAAQGRSVREFEEQMATLRKENFNLKLRLYFIEESIPGYQQANSPDGQETLMKQLIDTKVEIEILRKEIQEKQDILKEAAQAMNQMERIQKETEAKSQAVADELNQKIQYLEMEKEMEKSQNGEFMNELLGRSDLTENINAIQRIRELEGLVKQSEEKLNDFQEQISKLDEILQKRDETIKEYEEKVKELVFQNAELLEALENKDKEVNCAERTFRGLRKSNAELKEENQALIEALNTTQENFHKEMSNMKTYERQMREQQEALSKMQSTISIKTANTARLLDRIQEYEKMVTKMNFERNLAKRENRFFRAIIGKLQRNQNNECYTIEKEEIYQQIGSDYTEKPIDAAVPQNNRCFDFDANFREMKACGDFHGEYKLKQKLCVNFCNTKFAQSSSNLDGSRQQFNDECADIESDFEPEIPIRYTFSDSSMFASGGCSRSGGACKTDSCSSLQANFSSSSIIAGREITDEIYIKVKRLCAQLQEQKLELADKSCMLQEAEERLEKRNQVHEKACRTIQKLMKTITNLQEEKNKMKNNPADDASKEQVNVTSGLDSFGISRSMSDTEATNSLTPTQKIKYEKTISEQEELIHSLKSEVKKKTANLQNLVNKELWEKNREIERLMKLINIHKGDGQSPISPPPNNNATNELQQSFSETEFLKALERNKLLQKKVDILIQRLGMDHNNEALILQLQNDVREARNDAELAEKWRRECVDVCSVLSNRLEELANFLNSLLKHKDVLGMLAADRRKAMRKAINRSLDLSKSLNMTLSISGVSMGDQSILHISNLSELLGDDVGELENKTFNSHETLHAEVQSVETLKAENKALKQELDQRRSTEAIRKERRSLPLSCKDNQSESEAWSEPDRKVSMARIGLDDHSVAIVKSSAAVAVAAKSVDVETDSESDALNRSRSSKTPMPAPTRHMERIAQLEQLIAKRDDRILDIQCQLVDADSRLKKENLKVIDMTHELEQLRKRNEELNADLLAIGSEQDETLSEHNQSMLQEQINEKTSLLKNIQQERDEIVVKARASEMEIIRLQKELRYMDNHHESLMQEAQRQELQKLDELKSEFNAVLEARLATQKQQHMEDLARDWVERKLYDESQQQMKKLQSQLKEAQSHIEYLKENEEEMKKSLVDSELATRAIKKQLDESTMQASKAVLERTRALHEKLELEKREQELSAQLKQQEKECSSMRRQMEKLQVIKTVLQQQLDAAQALANKQHGSDGYTSEDVPLNGAKSASGDNVAPQRLNNPSPDLGIESDAGRVHSTEVSCAEHKQLKAVELVNSVKQENTDEKSTHVQQSQGHTDCAKVDQEIMELQRKLIRTKRALVETLEQLHVSNQKKAQVEKTIKNQILKTNNVLKNVRSNMENQM